jgi:tRNA(Ile)-lysidine synthase
VSYSAEVLLQRLSSFSGLAETPARYVVAFSGGLDSTVLLHTLASSQAQHGVPVLAVHVNHGLQEEAARWAEFCRETSATYGIDFVSHEVVVATGSGLGPEASAREARYACLRTIVQPDDWLLSAHHQDDQAETLLLNLLRGSGPAGLAGIGALRPFAGGWLVRPLLDVPRIELEEYTRRFELKWIEDPSNEEQVFDRNYLRHEVMPRLDSRWPDAAGRLRRSAQLASEASQLLSELAELDLAALGGKPDRLALNGLRALTPERQRNVLRHAVRRLGLPVPGAKQLQSIVADLIPARDDAQPLVCWSGIAARRYRDELYIVAENMVEAVANYSRVISGNRVDLGPGLGTLTLTADSASGLSESVVDAGLELRFRVGGEEFQPQDQRHKRKLKKLLQEAGVVPWMRERLPILYSGGRIVAVADLWVAADSVAEPGTAISWTNGPSIF